MSEQDTAQVTQPVELKCSMAFFQELVGFLMKLPYGQVKGMVDRIQTEFGPVEVPDSKESKDD